VILGFKPVLDDCARRLFELLQLDRVLVVELLGIAAVGELEILAFAIGFGVESQAVGGLHAERERSQPDVVAGGALQLQESIGGESDILARLFQSGLGFFVGKDIERVGHGIGVGFAVGGSEADAEFAALR